MATISPRRVCATRARPALRASVGLVGALVLLAGCASDAMKSPPATAGAPPPRVSAVLSDGELPLPADYPRWPKFLSAVQRPDAKQVREIYMNPVAAGGTAAAGFPLGSVFVMENYAARANADGTLATGADGKLVKGELLRVFVMGKDALWGQDVAPELRNGNWIYASYLAGGAKSADNLVGCRACHAPLGASKDFVHRYDEHFQKKQAAAGGDAPARVQAALAADPHAAAP